MITKEITNDLRIYKGCLRDSKRLSKYSRQFFENKIKEIEAKLSKGGSL